MPTPPERHHGTAADPPGDDSGNVVKVASVDRHNSTSRTRLADERSVKPIRAFDDGSRVHPDAARNEVSEAPALLVNAGSGTQMVNYQVRDYYIVDRLVTTPQSSSLSWTRSGPRDDWHAGATSENHGDSISDPMVRRSSEQKRKACWNRASRRIRSTGSSDWVRCRRDSERRWWRWGSSHRFRAECAQKYTDDPARARNGGEIADLAAHGGRVLAAPTFVPPPGVPHRASAVQQAPPKPPSRYAQWAEEKYIKALESRRWSPPGPDTGNRPLEWPTEARTLTQQFY